MSNEELMLLQIQEQRERANRRAEIRDILNTDRDRLTEWVLQQLARIEASATIGNVERGDLSAIIERRATLNMTENQTFRALVYAQARLMMELLEAEREDCAIVAEGGIELVNSELGGRGYDPELYINRIAAKIRERGK